MNAELVVAVERAGQQQVQKRWAIEERRAAPKRPTLTKAKIQTAVR